MARVLYTTAPDGTVLKRRTDNPYSFAVCVGNRHSDPDWRAPSWSASRVNAEKAAAKFRNNGYRVAVTQARETKDEVIEWDADDFDDEYVAPED